MKAIWKYAVKPGRFSLEIPENSRFRSLHVQRNEPQMWLEVDPHAPKETVNFCVYPTGLEFDDEGLRYLGSFLVDNGSLVFHLYTEQHGGDKHE